MKLVESYMTKNPCYAAKKHIEVEGIMLHSSQCPQPSAKVMIHNWDRKSYSRSCVHAFIDGNDGTVYQTLPWNHRGWHAFGSANNTHIGIEICEPNTIKYVDKEKFEVLDEAASVASVRKTYQSAVELCAQLCVKYDLDPIMAICSHAEGNSKGVASKRKDPEHLWEGLGLSYTMDGFRVDVKKEMEKVVRDPVTKELPNTPFMVKVTQVTPAQKQLIEEQLSTSKHGIAYVERLKEDAISMPEDLPVEKKGSRPTAEAIKITDVSEPSIEVGEPKFIDASTSSVVMVRIDVDRLRIRTGPGSDYAPTGKYTGKGVFAITEVQKGHGNSKGWGRLQNGSGWISLDYVAPYDGQ